MPRHGRGVAVLAVAGMAHMVQCAVQQQPLQAVEAGLLARRSACSWCVGTADAFT